MIEIKTGNNSIYFSSKKSLGVYFYVHQTRKSKFARNEHQSPICC